MAGPSLVMTDTNASEPCFQETDPTIDLVQKLTRGLTTSCNARRAPDHFGESLKNACQEPDASLSRTLLVAGFQAWFAYFVAPQQARHDLEQLDPSLLTLVAGEVARVALHSTVEQLFVHLFSGSRGRTCRLHLKSISVQAPAPPEASSRNFRSSTRPRQSAATMATQGEGSSISEIESAHNRPPELEDYSDNRSEEIRATSMVTIYGSIGFDFNAKTQLGWPAAVNLGHVFPSYQRANVR
ncbi:hypothetical protein K505DRAFT_328764 [Melanomma pulvis-pyrius CBS 109.77]|uniref:Uncharacterized protein n=1 Tax=Melanomma pulvis-pyrius CBS 109.77 TaxID=1314802 RepID=A0A6A6WX68_9PLEO|nr:hypothetical protein K505DRAFT_328764 [Melanomma pulvis-pyrius CBS 109.77]